jgi:glycosyltransferase involved in cell wall biosynthesis
MNFRQNDAGDATGVPKSLEAMARQAGPARIVIIDSEEPLPLLEADEHYKNAWVVLLQANIPRCMVMIDLTMGATAIQSRLREMIGRPDISRSNFVETTPFPNSALPRISVVVPTIVTRIEELGHCIEAIRQLDYPDFEVLIVDNRRELPKKDPLPMLVESKPWLRVIREPRPGISAARNAGVAEATGEIIAFTDDDVRVDPQWLRAIGTRMTSFPRIEAVTGLILPTELETPSQIWFERYFGGFGSERTFDPITLESARSRQPLLRGSKILVRNAADEEVRQFSIYGVGAFGAGANMAFRKSTLERIGGFDPVLGVGTPAPGGEDVVAIIDILWSGGQVGYEPSAYVHHRHRREYGELLKQIDGYGLGYTAMLIALIRNDRRHIVSILAQIPVAFKWKAKQGFARLRARNAGTSTTFASTSLYPSTLFAHEVWAFTRGPLAYARSRRKWMSINSTDSKLDEKM